MGKHNIITIGREFGSGGREVGIKVAEKLGIPFYDKEILANAAKESGFSEDIFEKHDEKPTNSFLYSIALGIGTMGQAYQKPLMLELYLAQFESIKELASKGPGVFIGRCSDYVLSDVDKAFHVFINADMDARIARISEKYGVDAKKASEMCLRNDKDRASYYNYYSDARWGDSRHYDLCINTTTIGIDKAADIIIECL